MNIRVYIKQLAGKSTWEWTAKTACLLNGAWNCYEAAGWEEGREAVAAAMEQLELDMEAGYEPDLAAAGCARLLFPLYGEHAPERGKAVIGKLLERLPGLNIPDGAKEGWERDFYLAEPFYLEYENTVDRKEQYHQIQAQLKAAAELTSGQSCREQQDRLAAGWYLMALIDCCGLISEEVFDHYKNAERYFKDALKEVLKKADDLPPAAMTAYVILKGCRLRALLPEKYADLAVGLLESYQDIPTGEEAGIYLLACGEYKKLGLGGEFHDSI